MENIQLNRIEEMMGTLIKMVGENNSRLQRLEEKTDRLEMKVDKLETKTDKLEMKVDKLETKTDKLESDTEEIKGNVKELLHAQERQDRILEILSVKSIETDSYIRDFKRKM